jgi:hypothetical protein
MPLIIQHRRVNIVTLYQDESIPEYCQPGDIALKQEHDGWWAHFIGENGEIDSYDAPFENYDKAMWTAKAAAEFSTE